MIWDNTSIIYALIGGVLIALATSGNLWIKGRITGFSGAFFSLITINYEEGFIWKICFVSGLITMTFPFWYFEIKWAPYDWSAKQNLSRAIIGGLLVGFGTKTGNGCTSGHAVCGIPRLSLRSFVATCIFMITGIAVATLIPFLNITTFPDIDIHFLDTNYKFVASIFFIILFLFFLYEVIVSFIKGSDSNVKTDPIISFLLGLIFGLGLLISGMCDQNRILAFLNVDLKTWNPSLLFVMMAALGINLITFQYILRNVNKPILNDKFAVPKVSVIDFKLILGASAFGFGWGIFGFCPGPAMINAFFSYKVLFFLLSMSIGMAISYWLFKPSSSSSSHKEVNTKEKTK